VIRPHAGYLKQALFEPEAIVQKAREVCLDVHTYDTLVGTGLSGALVAPLLAREFGKTFLIVRKDSDGSHSGNLCEGELGGSWVFVDDLIDSGSTLRRVRHVVGMLCGGYGHTSEYRGTFLYCDPMHPTFSGPTYSY
jgi:adenine/guanine phosphoribosyltransferase-like PRPP-binding protein